MFVSQAQRVFLVWPVSSSILSLALFSAHSVTLWIRDRTHYLDYFLTRRVLVRLYLQQTPLLAFRYSTESTDVRMAGWRAHPSIYELALTCCLFQTKVLGNGFDRWNLNSRDTVLCRTPALMWDWTTCLDFLNLPYNDLILSDFLFIMDFLVEEFPISAKTAFYKETRTIVPETGSQLSK